MYNTNHNTNHIDKYVLSQSNFNEGIVNNVLSHVPRIVRSATIIRFRCARIQMRNTTGENNKERTRSRKQFPDETHANVELPSLTSGKLSNRARYRNESDNFAKRYGEGMKTNGAARGCGDAGGWFKLAVPHGWRINSLFGVPWRSRRRLIVTFAETSPEIVKGIENGRVSPELLRQKGDEKECGRGITPCLSRQRNTRANVWRTEVTNFFI